jgi:hypothetical protein
MKSTLTGVKIDKEESALLVTEKETVIGTVRPKVRRSSPHCYSMPQGLDQLIGQRTCTPLPG